MMQYLPLISVFLLLSWQVLRTPQRQFSSCVLIETDDSLIVLMLLLALLLNMLAKKQALASEPVEFAPSAVPYVAETLTTPELYLFTKCFKAQLDPAAKVEYETERRRYIIRSGTLKLRISSC